MVDNIEIHDRFVSSRNLTKTLRCPEIVRIVIRYAYFSLFPHKHLAPGQVMMTQLTTIIILFHLLPIHRAFSSHHLNSYPAAFNLIQNSSCS